MAQLHGQVLRQLEANRADYTILRHDSCPGPIQGPADFAACLGWPLERITKTLLLRDKSPGGRFCAITLPASRRTNLAAAATAVGVARLRFASSEELAQATGYPSQGVSPLGLQDIPVMVDGVLLQYPTIAVGGGSLGVEVELAPALLVELTQAIVESLSLA